MVNGGQQNNPTPNNMLDDSDEVEGCSNFWYAGIGTRDGMGCIKNGNLMTSGMSRSRHTGGVNVGLGDGSVRFLQNGIDELTWCLLISKADGQVIGGNY